MVGPKNWAVPGQVVEAVHNNGHHNVQHDERTEEDEGHKIEIGHVRAASLVGLDPVTRRLVDFVSSLVAFPARDARHHYVGPGLTSGTPKSNHKSFCLRGSGRRLNGPLINDVTQIWTEWTPCTPLAILFTLKFFRKSDWHLFFCCRSCKDLENERLFLGFLILHECQPTLAW